MQLPKNTSAYLKGAAGGAIILALVGFNWGGWLTGGTADKQARAAAHDAVVAALAPICAERFRAQNDAGAKIAALASGSEWERGNAIEKSGFATMPGAKDADSDVARACGTLLSTPTTPKA